MVYYQPPGYHHGGFPGHSGGTPTYPPPPFIPPFPAWQTGSEGIRGCINRHTYIWMRNGEEFWFLPTFVGRQTIIGYQWRRFGWTYGVVDRGRIRSYQCF